MQGGKQDKENPTTFANRLQSLAQIRYARCSQGAHEAHLTTLSALDDRSSSINRLSAPGKPRATCSALKCFGRVNHQHHACSTLISSRGVTTAADRRVGSCARATASCTVLLTVAKAGDAHLTAGYARGLRSTPTRDREDPLFSHAGGGGAALRAHARYVARDAAARASNTSNEEGLAASTDQADSKARAHSKYLERTEGSVFYDATVTGLDGGERAASWARTDRRHFRLILSPENWTKLGDLKAYTREVMRRAEIALGSRLEWVAVDHWDSDNPHTHIILRGVRSDGRDLIIPREFVQHGFRSVARDVATERLGNRTREDARQALHREVRAHWPTSLITGSQINSTRMAR